MQSLFLQWFCRLLKLEKNFQTKENWLFSVVIARANMTHWVRNTLLNIMVWGKGLQTISTTACLQHGGNKYWKRSQNSVW